MDWEKLLINYGLPTAMVIYLLVRDAKRDKRRDDKEDATALQFAKLNEQQNELTKSCIAAVTTSNELNRKLEGVVERVLNFITNDDEPKLERRKTGPNSILHQ